MPQPKLSRIPTAFAAIALLLVTATFGACGQKPQQAAPPPMPVIVRPLSEASVSDMSEYMATLISRHSVTLQSRVPGQIKAIYATAGDKVKQGDVLLLVDPSQQQAAVQSAGAAAQSLQSNISQASKNLQVLQEQRQALESDLEMSQLQYKRYETLAAQKSASLQDLERYRNELKQAQANLAGNTAQIQAQQAAVAGARKQYEQAQASSQEQRALLQYYKITAPFSGVVGDVPVKVGNYVQPLTELLNVTDNDPLEVNISVPSEYMQKLHIGLPVELIDSQGTPLGMTNVSFIAPNVDATAQTILVKAIIPNPKGLLKAAQLVNAHIVWKQMPGLRIPTQSVVRMGGRDFAYVIESPKANAQKNAKSKPQYNARLVPVQLGRIEGPSYIVESGLHKGQWLVVSGTQKLGDGAPVNPQFENSESP